MDVAPLNPKRMTIIPFIHGKITRDGKMSEPDIHWIIEKWLERHPEIKKRTQDIRVTRGTMTLPQGFKADLIRATIVAGEDIEGYDPAQDQDLYAILYRRRPGRRLKPWNKRKASPVAEVRRLYCRFATTSAGGKELAGTPARNSGKAMIAGPAL